MHKKVPTFMRSDVFLILDAISLSKTLTLMFDHNLHVNMMKCFILSTVLTAEVC